MESDRKDPTVSTVGTIDHIAANRKPKAVSTPTLSLRDQAVEPDDGYVRLCQAIVQRQFFPKGRLIETDLAKSFRLGHATVRAALARLEPDGLVEGEPYRGARVRAISVADALRRTPVGQLDHKASLI